MESKILKSEIILNSDTQRVYMYTKCQLENIDKIIDTIYKIYDVDYHILKGNILLVFTKLPRVNITEHFLPDQLENIYRTCVLKFKQSQPYFDTDITKSNVILDQDMFDILPMGTDAFDLHPMAQQNFRQTVLQGIYDITGFKNEDMFDKILGEHL